MKQAVYREGSHWEIATTANPYQGTKYYDQIDERAAWLYEAILNNQAMRSAAWRQMLGDQLPKTYNTLAQSLFD